MPFRRFARRFSRRPMTRFRTRRGPKAEVSNFAYATSLELTASQATFLNPAVNVTEVISLASMVTDPDVANVPTRTIPPQYKGMRVLGGSLDVDIVISAGPAASAVEIFGENSWAGGWSAGNILLYVDDFIWSAGVQTPDLSVVHPWQNDLIAGAPHVEFDRPTRILVRHSFTLPGVVDIESPGIVHNRAALHRRFQLRIRKCYLSERASLWLAVCGTNPWSGTSERNINWGINVTGAIAYRVRSA